MRTDAAFVSLVQTIRRWTRPGQTLLVGMVGLPGAGKSTLAAQLVDELSELRAVSLSLDDFYLSGEERQSRGFAFRGPPGSHDLEQVQRFLDQLRARPCQLSVPVYDRGAELPLPPRLCRGPLDLCLLEGFLVGITAPGYEPLRDSLDRLIFVEIDPEAALKSRLAREAAQLAAGRGGMNPDEVLRFWHESLWPQVERYVLPLRERADVIVQLRPDHSLQMVYFPDGTLRN